MPRWRPAVASGNHFVGGCVLRQNDASELWPPLQRGDGDGDDERSLKASLKRILRVVIRLQWACNGA